MDNHVGHVWLPRADVIFESAGEFVRTPLDRAEDDLGAAVSVGYRGEWPLVDWRSLNADGNTISVYCNAYFAKIDVHLVAAQVGRIN